MNIESIDADSYSLSAFAFGPLSGRRYVVFDVEATGPDHGTDSVTQIGAVAVYDEGPRDEDSFSRLVRPGKPIPPKIESLTGITNELVASAADFSTVWREFIDYCGDSTLVTQCGYEFDFPLIDRECARIGVPLPVQPRLDTKAIFALTHPERSDTFSTNFLSDYYGIDRTAFRRHDALGDAKLISRFFYAQLQEARRQNQEDWVLRAPIRIKRFVLPPL